MAVMGFLTFDKFDIVAATDWFHSPVIGGGAEIVEGWRGRRVLRGGGSTAWQLSEGNQATSGEMIQVRTELLLEQWPGSASSLVQLNTSDGFIRATLRYGGNAGLQLTDGATTVLHTGADPLPIGEPLVLDWRVQRGPAGQGWSELYVNGQQYWSLTNLGFSSLTSNVGRVRLVEVSGGRVQWMWAFVLRSGGAAPNEALTNAEVALVLPVGVSEAGQWSRTTGGSALWEAVARRLANEEGDVLESSASQHSIRYAVDLTGNERVHALRAWGRRRRTSGTVTGGNVGLVLDGTAYQGGVVGGGTNWSNIATVWWTNPRTGQPWAAGDMEGLELLWTIGNVSGSMQQLNGAGLEVLVEVEASAARQQGYVKQNGALVPGTLRQRTADGYRRVLVRQPRGKSGLCKT
jgi:hypothetical protein